MKYIGIAKVVSISAVTAKLSGYGSTYSDGMIFVDIPELGLSGENQILCRYGFCIPYALVKVGQKLWVEPTLHDNERWVYTGYVDCMVDAISSTTESILYVNSTQFIKLKSNGVIEMKNGSSKIEIAAAKIDLTATDVNVIGKLNVDKEIIWNNDTVATHASTHIHPTPVGPSGSPVAGS